MYVKNRVERSPHSRSVALFLTFALLFSVLFSQGVPARASDESGEEPVTAATEPAAESAQPAAPTPEAEPTASPEPPPTPAEESRAESEATTPDPVPAGPADSGAEEVPADTPSPMPEPTEEAAVEASPSPSPSPPPFPVGDRNADVEFPRYWETMFAALDFTGEWQSDFLLAVRSQLGYQASERNFYYSADGEQHRYTRYGAWYGYPYGDWCAMFLSFCLHYAGVSEDVMPQESGVNRWAALLQERGQFIPAGDYVPQPGELVFFTNRWDRIPEHIGVVSEVIQKEDGHFQIITIEGNRTPAVMRFLYDLNAKGIAGFGVFPQNDALTDQADGKPAVPGRGDYPDRSAQGVIPEAQ